MRKACQGSLPDTTTGNVTDAYLVRGFSSVNLGDWNLTVFFSNANENQAE